MPLTPTGAKFMLDWLTGAAVVLRPSERWIEFATATPTSISSFAAPVQTRISWNAAAASSPLGAATNRSAGTVTATAACTIVAWNLYGTGGIGSGVRYAYGTFSSTLGCASGDTPAFAAGALTITLK